MMTDDGLEHAWVMVGQERGKLWWETLLQREETVGTTVSVMFDDEFVQKRHTHNKDVIGFLHLHPGMHAVPSSRDDRTMAAWTTCLGKSLLCLIEGVDGLRGWWYDEDEPEPVECQVQMLQVGSNRILFGTTEITENDHGEQPIAERENGQQVCGNEASIDQ